MGEFLHSEGRNTLSVLRISPTCGFANFTIRLEYFANERETQRYIILQPTKKSQKMTLSSREYYGVCRSPHATVLSPDVIPRRAYTHNPFSDQTPRANIQSACIKELLSTIFNSIEKYGAVSFFRRVYFLFKKTRGAIFF